MFLSKNWPFSLGQRTHYLQLTEFDQIPFDRMDYFEIEPVTETDNRTYGCSDSQLW